MAKLMELISALRSDFRISDLPFVVGELCEWISSVSTTANPFEDATKSKARKECRCEE